MEALSESETTDNFVNKKIFLHPLFEQNGDNITILCCKSTANFSQKEYSWQLRLRFRLIKRKNHFFQQL